METPARPSGWPAPPALCPAREVFRLRIDPYQGIASRVRKKGRRPRFSWKSGALAPRKLFGIGAGFRVCVRTALSPLRGLLPPHFAPTAYAVGFILAPLRGWRRSPCSTAEPRIEFSRTLFSPPGAVPEGNDFFRSLFSDAVKKGVKIHDFRHWAPLSG